MDRRSLAWYGVRRVVMGFSGDDDIVARLRSEEWMTGASQQMLFALMRMPLFGGAAALSSRTRYD
jgi:hypothetical protein